MKKTTMIMLIILTLFTFSCVSSSQSLNTIDLTQNSKIMTDFMIDENFSNYDDLTIYHLDLNIDSSNGILKGKEIISYKNNEETDLHEIYFKLFLNNKKEYISVSSIYIENEEVKLYRDKNNLRNYFIKLPNVLKKGERLNITINFSFYINTPRTGYISNYSTDKELSLMYFYPIISVFQDGKWDNVKINESGDPTHLDLAEFIIDIEINKNINLVVPGQLVHKNINENIKNEIYTIGPSRDIIILGGEYLKKEISKHEDFKVLSYYFGESQELGIELANIGKQAISMFSNNIYKYPYKNYKIAPIYSRFGGIEYMGMTGITSNYYYYAQYTPLRRSIMENIEETIVHEIAHMWFYGLIHGDQQKEAWIDEGMAQYLTYYYMDEKYTGYGKYDKEATLSTWNRINKENKLSIGLEINEYKPKSNEYVYAVYYGAKLFFIELEELIGRENFINLISDFVNEYKWENIKGIDYLNYLNNNTEINLIPIYKKWFINAYEF